MSRRPIEPSTQPRETRRGDPGPPVSAPARRAARGWAPGEFAARSLLGLVAAICAGAAFVVVLTLVAAEWRPLHTADQAVVDAVNSLISSSGVLVTAAKTLSYLGSPLGVGIVVVVPVIWLLIRRLPRLASFVAVTGAGAAVLGTGVKALVDRARPVVEVPLSSPSGDSFPSGHAVAVTIGWGALLLVFLPVVPRRGRRAAIACVVGVIVIVGLTRVALGAHYPSDVIAGWLLGALWLAVTALAFRTSRDLEGLAGPTPGIDVLSAQERHALHPAPAHDHPLPQSWRTAAKLVVAAVLLCGALVGVGLLITGPLTSVQRFDAEVVAWFATIGSGTWTEIALAIGWLGGVAGNVTVLAIAVPLASAITRRWAPALFLLLATGGQAAIYLAASRLVARDRPGLDSGDLLATVSFPSGHVGASVATYGAIALLVLTWSGARARYAAIVLAVAVVLIVAFSRLYHDVHYPSDVIAAMAYAFVWLGLCWRWLRPAPARRREDAEDACATLTRRHLTAAGNR